MNTRPMPEPIKQVELLEKQMKDLDEQIRSLRGYLTELERQMNVLKK